jgi:hypothetical protein
MRWCGDAVFAKRDAEQQLLDLPGDVGADGYLPLLSGAQGSVGAR